MTYKLKATPSGTGSTLKLTSKPVVLYTRTGSLTGTGSATLVVTGPSTATVKDGKLILTKGAGGQKGHSFVGTFSGSGNPTTGIYTFHYKGTYK